MDTVIRYTILDVKGSTCLNMVGFMFLLVNVEQNRKVLIN